MILEQFTSRAPHDGIVDHRSLPEAKIALFRALFRGREDVYPRRFESRKTGKTGYQPVCANEWVQGVCEKPRIKVYGEERIQIIGMAYATCYS